MNQIIKELIERKSVRAYRDEKITLKEKNMILQSAIQAPTAGNMALYSIIDVQDQQLKDQLAKTCDHQPFISQAPLVLLFLADYQKWYDMYCTYHNEDFKLEEADMILALEDAMIAAQNAVVGAWSLGIGSCYIGDILENFEIHQELFDLPKYAVPATLVVFGKPTPQQQNRQKPPRFDINDMVSVNTYHHKSMDETKQMFIKQSGRSEQQLQSYIQAFAKRKFFAQYHQEMNRSVRKIIESWTK